jgi:UDP-N-acetyl-D-glucosamine dehydrogenase
MSKRISYKNLLSIYHGRTDNYIKRPVVCIQGLGFVGAAMSTAVSIAKSNSINYFNVIGVDLDNKLGNERINSINKGIFPFNTNDEFLKQSLHNSYLNQNVVATSNERAFSLANIIVIDIHLDINFLDDKPLLDFKRLKNAIATIASHIKKEALVIVETTVPPGTSEKIILPTFEEELNKRGMSLDDIYIAHSYERVMPGDNYLDSIINYWRVYSGMNKGSADLCESFLSKIINIKEYPLSRLSSMTASETAKVLENTYRASNIAFIDEWTKFAELVSINLFEVIDAIKKRPTHNNIMKPGLGVGGYCLTKDSSFAPASLEQLFNITDHKFPFSSLSNKVNNDMPLHVFNRTKSSLDNNLEGKRILIFGVAYRENVGDTRFAPCELYARNCMADGATVDYLDPYVEYWPEMEMHSQIEPINYGNYDLLLIAVSHKEFIEFDYNQIAKYSNLIIIDAANLLKEDQMIQKEFECKVIKIGNGEL